MHSARLSRGAILATTLLAVTFAWTEAAAAEVSSAAEPVMTGSAEIFPSKLPRSQSAPSTLRLGFTSEAPDTHAAPELSKTAFEISRNVTLRTAGLPSCSLAKLLSTYANPRRTCAGSLVGQGRVVSEITLPGEPTVTVEGRLLAFFAFAEERPRILAQVSSTAPLSLTYVIPFRVDEDHGAFGSSLVVPKMRNIQGQCRRGVTNCFSQPYTLKGIYAHISDFELSLHRRFAHDGRRQSVVNARCPAPADRAEAVFPLANVSLSYSSGASLSSVSTGRCRIAA